MLIRNNIMIKYMSKNNKILQSQQDDITSKTNVYHSISFQLKNILFEEKYPNQSFCDLNKLNDHYSNDDNCIYYKHKLTKKIYSWNYILKKWI